MRTRVRLLLTLALFAPQLGCGSDDDSGRDAAQVAANPDAAAADGGGDLGPSSATGVATGATVVGTLALPGAANGKPWAVRLLTMAGVPNAPIIAQAAGTTNGSTMIWYTIANVPPGTYFVLGFVDVDGSGGDSSTPGDYAGWFGHGGDGNPPAAPNALVVGVGTVRLDFSLVLR